MEEIKWSLTSKESLEKSTALEPAPVENLPPLIWRVLQARGFVHKQQVEQAFQPSLKELTHPACLSGMNEAVVRLQEALEKQEKVCIYGDFDMDGTPGVVLLKEGLEKLGFQKTHDLSTASSQGGVWFSQ